MMKMDIHPAASVWPMLPDEDLQQLADSIAEVGLLEPLVRWIDPDTGEMLLLDGRNRAAACRLAGVEPTFVDYDGDPVAFVLARNQHRRHMTKGQLAMAAWTTASVNHSQPTTVAVGRAAQVDRSMASMAKAVADHAPDLVALVIDGTVPLKEAYDEARKMRDRANSDQARMDRLTEQHPDLAAQVRDETLTLTEAMAAADARVEEQAAKRRDARQLVSRIVMLIGADTEQPPEFVRAWVDHIDPHNPDDPMDLHLLPMIDRASAMLADLAKGIRP